MVTWTVLKRISSDRCWTWASATTAAAAALGDAVYYCHAKDTRIDPDIAGVNGVIDTIAWEGYREGVDDVRYITTLHDLGTKTLRRRSDGLEHPI